MTQRPWRLAVLALCTSAAASSVLALGFGRIPESTVFGQALDLSVPLHLDPGESLSPACLSAVVSVGEQRLPGESVQLSVQHTQAGYRLRLRSPLAVLEPMVSVHVTVGCLGSVSRQFVVFADPPPHAADALPPPAAEFGSAAPTASASLTAAPPTTRAAAATKAGGAARGPSPLASKMGRSAGKGDKSRSSPPAAVALKTRPAQSSAAGAARKAASVSAAISSAPQLKLDEPEALLQAARLAVATQDAALASAGQTASAAQAAASAAESRLAAMDRELQTLRADAAANRAALEQMRSRTASAEERGQFSGWLISMLALLAVVALWLAWRLRAVQRERQALWWQAAAAPLAYPAAEPVTATVAEMPQQAEAPAAEVAQLIPAADTEDPLGEDLAEPAPARPLSVDELIDVEQQADFFVVLGEDESAVDLLMTHLRGSGGVSPLPYLKLLEIFRRSADREAYERTRKRFNQRFNAVAPSWDEDLQRGRSLLDYPGVLSSLQAAWPAPLDAMAELENLLFRKRGGELFELPAYRDVLSLYAVARDLHRHVDEDGVDVDLLLPLGPAHAHDVTARLSIFDRLDSTGESGAVAAEDRPTAPIDLDLSEPEAAPRR